MFKALVTAAALAAPTCAQAQTVEDFVSANILATLYHELGHALIDIEQIPIFGQEEDAADVLSVLLIDAFWEEEDAVSLAYDTAFGFQAEAQYSEDMGYEVAFWDVHGPDEQRYYNLVCLFYGANVDERDDVAQELGLPEERAEWCEDEFYQANDSWGAVLDDISVDAPGDTIELGPFARQDYIADLLVDEVDALNQDFYLSDYLVVSYEPCGEPNAFYDPRDRWITICTEYVDYLSQIVE